MAALLRSAVAGARSAATIAQAAWGRRSDELRDHVIGEDAHFRRQVARWRIDERDRIGVRLELLQERDQAAGRDRVIRIVVAHLREAIAGERGGGERAGIAEGHCAGRCEVDLLAIAPKAPCPQAASGLRCERKTAVAREVVERARPSMRREIARRADETELRAGEAA